MLNKNDETDDAISEFIGYDFIGVEGQGTIHSFHCQCITPELNERFGLTLNKKGLFDTMIDHQSIRNYLNGKEAEWNHYPGTL